MDLIEILRERTESLAVGEHTVGLRAVLQHVQAAESHFHRGKSTGDDAAFTDTIYRTNQAFEGSLKEAYRVLAGKDPAKMRPSDIEAFFQNKGDLDDAAFSPSSLATGLSGAIRQRMTIGWTLTKTKRFSPSYQSWHSQ